MVLCKCGCGKEIIVKPYHKYYGIPNYISGHHQVGKILSIEIKLKIANSRKGKHHSKETKQKIGNSNWKGGKRLADIKHSSKHRKLGFNLLNKPFENSEGHHINQNDVIYIPKEWHRIIAHNVWKGKNMEIVNTYAYFFLLMQNSSSYSV